MRFDIRPVIQDDLDQLLRLMVELRRFLDDPEIFQTRDTLARDIFGDAPEVRVLVAEADGQLWGYILYQDAYEPAYATRGAYVGDLYVRKGARKNGIGRALLDAAAADVKTRNRSFLWLVAVEDNSAAHLFYKKLGADTHPVRAHAFILETFDAMAERGRPHLPNK